MHVHIYEKWWIGISASVLVIFVAALVAAGFALGVQVPAPQGRVNPNTVRDVGPFSTPGLRELAPGKYEAHIRAEAQPWKFEPKELEIPVGSTVIFYVTSTDVQHGFDIAETNVNMMVLPGQISKLTAKFEKEGVYHYICNEYCGVGHQNMFGTITVVPAKSIASIGSTNDSSTAGRAK